MTSCSVSRRTRREVSVDERVSERVRTGRMELRDSVYRTAAVAVHDSVREMTTVTVQIGAQGDTVMRSVVTDRFRVLATDSKRDVAEKVVVRRDTVYLETDTSVRRDEVAGQARDEGWYGGFVYLIKWLVVLVGSLIVLRVVWVGIGRR